MVDRAEKDQRGMCEVVLGEELPPTTHSIHFPEPGDLYVECWNGSTEWHINVRAGTTLKIGAKVVIGGPNNLVALYEIPDEIPLLIERAPQPAGRK